MKIALIVAIIILIACLFHFGYSHIKKDKTNNTGNTISSSSLTSSGDPGKAPDKVEVPEEFTKDKKINNDVYAWITVPGTPVNYPILQSEKNEYYLNRDINKKYSVYGSIFSETYNTKDFSDFNTLLYGHNMKNGSMFGSLKKFRDPEFFKKNREIIVYMPNRMLKYEIFAACTWDNKHILANRNFSLEENRTAYIEEVMAVRDMSSQVLANKTVTADDKIITLSTCMNDKKKRFIVSGVLIYDSQNP